jgi:O-antigen/teichoic acid export membrane protein
MYTRANRLVALLGSLIGGSLLGMAPVFFAFWLGTVKDSPVPITDAAACLAVTALLIGLPRPAAAATIMAMGRVGLGVRAQFAAFVINLGLTIAFVKPLGMVGVMLATVLAKLVATGYLLARFHRLIEGSARELLFSWMTKLLAAIVAGAGCARLVLLFLPDSVVHQRGPALGALVLLGAVYASAFVLVIRVTRYFSDEDLSWFQEILPGPLSKLIAHRFTRGLLGVGS